MKRLFIKAVLLISIQISLLASNASPLLVCAIMVKNEEPVLAKTLQAALDVGINAYLILDTGSTDKTIAVAKDFFISHGIEQYAIEQEPFVDFAVSRNRTLDLVDQHFPDAVFVLMIDAEWKIGGGTALMNFCENIRSEKHDVYKVRLIIGDSFEYRVNRLIRRSNRPRYKGSVHEDLVLHSIGIAPKEIYISYSPSRYGREKSFDRWHRDVGRLLSDHAKNQNDPRTVFYLAQTYECLADYENAQKYYLMRAQMNGEIEENFMALYRLGGTVEELAKRSANNETEHNWARAQWYYLKAFAMRSSRVEPLVRIARHYLVNDEYELAYLFAWAASQIVPSEDDYLFVEKEKYTYERYDILAQSAWCLQRYVVAEWALNKMLEHHADRPYIHSFLALLNSNESRYEENKTDKSNQLQAQEYLHFGDIARQRENRSWAFALFYYLKAFAICPTSVAPLLRICQHYYDTNNMPLLYLFAQYACQIAEPLIVEPEKLEDYRYARYDFLSIAAWYVGAYAQGEWAAQNALGFNANDERLQKNLAFYLNRQAYL